MSFVCVCLLLKDLTIHFFSRGVSLKNFYTGIVKYLDNFGTYIFFRNKLNQRTNGPVNAHLISWPSKAQNIQNLEKYMVKK